MEEYIRICFNEEFTLESNYKYILTELKDKTFKLECSDKQSIQKQIGVMLIDYLNNDFNNNKKSIEYITSNFGINILFSISSIEEKYLFKTKEEYNKYIEKVYKNRKEDLIQSQQFFKAMLNQIFNYSKDSIFLNIPRQIKGQVIYECSELDMMDLEIYEESYEQVISLDYDNKLKKQYLFTETNNIISLMYFFVKELSKFDTITINKCEYCNDYFLPLARSNEKFCSKVYSNGTSCRSIGTKLKWKESIKRDEAKKLYNNMYQKKLMQLKRSNNDEKLKNSFDKWKEESKYYKKIYNNDMISEKEFINWLNKSTL